MDFKDITKVLQLRESAQTVEKDKRDRFRECRDAETSPNGYWEQSIWDSFSTFNRPRYNFNVVKPKILKKWGELASQEVQVNVKPSTGGDKDTAKTLCGLFRSVEYQSEAQNVYSSCLLESLITGFDAAMIEQDYEDNDSFSQELFIRKIPDAVNRVWFLGNWVNSLADDAPAVTVDYMLDDDEVDEKFPDLKIESLGVDSDRNTYYHKREGKIISQLFYKEYYNKTIYQDEQGNIYDDETVKELAGTGIDIKSLRSRERRTFKIMSRYYDAKKWLNEPEETVFDLLPVFPLQPNFRIVDNKPISSGEVENHLDQQRVVNYAWSKFVGDTALAPKPKIWMTMSQLGLDDKVRAKIKTYNTNDDPVQLYENDPSSPPPFQMGASGVSPELSQLIGMSVESIDTTSGLMGPAEGKQFARQSVESIEALQHKGDISSLVYFNAWKQWILQIAKCAIRAMPKVYDTPMIKRLISEEGEYESADLNRDAPVFDKMGNPIGVKKINDISAGVYDVYCDIGMAIRSKKEQTARWMDILADKDPTIVQDHKDVFMGSIDLPGMDKIAARERHKLLMAGGLLESELTDEERQKLQELSQQPKEPDPMQKIADAELRTAEAKATSAQVDAQATLIKYEQAQQKMDFEQEIQRIKAIEEKQKSAFDRQEQMVDILNKMADTMNKIYQSTGADSIVSPDAAMAYQETAENMVDIQNRYQFDILDNSDLKGFRHE